jgi:hypothetical protein
MTTRLPPLLRGIATLDLEFNPLHRSLFPSQFEGRLLKMFGARGTFGVQRPVGELPRFVGTRVSSV